MGKFIKLPKFLINDTLIDIHYFNMIVYNFLEEFEINFVLLAIIHSYIILVKVLTIN